MNFSLYTLKKYYFRYSSTLSLFCTLIVVIIYILFLTNKTSTIISFILFLISSFSCYITTVKFYRYSLKRKMTTEVSRLFGTTLVLFVAGLGSLSVFGLNPEIVIVIILSGCGFGLMKWSKEIKRSHDNCFEHCGNWQIRRVLGISLMVLPLLFYTLVFLCKILY